MKNKFFISDDATVCRKADFFCAEVERGDIIEDYHLAKLREISDF